MKKKIVALLVSIFIIMSLYIPNVVALSLEDKPYFYDVQIDKEGEILGDGDTIDIFCSLVGFDGTVNDCYCLIDAYSSNIQVPLYYNEDTERYEGSYTFGKTYDNPTRACYIMLISSYENGITTYFNEDTHPFGNHSFYYCNKCKDKIHYPVIDESKVPTCTDDGMTEGSHCSLCKTVIKSQETIPANGHAWDGGKITPQICTVCGKELKPATGVTEPPAAGSTDELTSPKENENPENGEFPVVIVVAIVVLVVGIAAGVIIWKKKN